MFRFIHASDIHLDSPLNNLRPYDGAPVEAFSQCTRQAFENLIALAISEAVQFVLIAGDLYDQDWKDFNTGLYFRRQMGRLHEAGIPVFIVRGNHDAASQITRSLSLPENVTVFSSDRPECICLDPIRVAVHGQSFPAPAVRKDLSRRYPPPRPGYFNIGLLHTCLSGREGHEPYAPCSLERLVNAGYHYWALGHVHQHEVLNEDPPVVFAGSLQGRHVREMNPKGCVLVSVDDTHRAALEFRPLDVVRWTLVPVPADGVLDGHELLERIEQRLKAAMEEHEGRPLAVRLRVEGETPLADRILAERDRWTGEIRGRAGGIPHGRIWIETVRFNLRMPPAGRAAVSPDGALGEVMRLLEEFREDPGLGRAFCAELADLEKKLPIELKNRPDGVSLGSADWLRDLLAEVKPGLIGRLLPGEDPHEN